VKKRKLGEVAGAEEIVAGATRKLQKGSTTKKNKKK
jgi:hypothetical protein